MSGEEILIPRTIYIRTVFSSREYVGAYGLEAYTGLSTTNVVETHKVVFYGLLAQEEGFTNTHLINSSEYIVFKTPRSEFCRWHSGPLNVEEDPLKREYCVEKSHTAQGYCRYHRDDAKALYSCCFESRGLDGLVCCEQLDKLFRDSIVYLIYMLAFSSNGFKVGSTRKWRMLQRLAEQPHVIASTLYVSNSACDARMVESRAGKLPWLTEVPRRDVYGTISTSLRMVLNRFVMLREKTLRTLRLAETELELVRVKPSFDLEAFHKARIADLKSLLDKKLEVFEYGYGYLLLSDIVSNEYFLIKFSDIMNRDCLKTIR